MADTQTSSQDKSAGNSGISESLAVAYVLLAVVGLIAVWATCVAIWGVPGLYIPALLLVFVTWVALIVISFG